MLEKEGLLALHVKGLVKKLVNAKRARVPANWLPINSVITVHTHTPRRQKNKKIIRTNTRGQKDLC